MRLHPAFFALVPVVCLAACARNVIPNTDVEDNPHNREVVAFCERYRQALIDRNTAELLALVSEDYFDDNGTLRADDDVNYAKLRERLPRWRVSEVRYEINYRRVLPQTTTDEIYVDVRYTGNFTLHTEAGDHYTRRLADNRMVLRRENGELRIVSGL